MKNFDPVLRTFLETNNLDVAYYEHIPVFTVEESEQIKHTIPGAHTKNLFLTDKKGGFYLVTIAAHKRFPVNAFRKQLGTKELSFGTPEQLFEKLRLTPGSVSLFGLIYDIPATIQVYIDTDLWHAPTVGRHPNRNDATLVINHETLNQFIQKTGHNLTPLDLTTLE